MFDGGSDVCGWLAVLPALKVRTQGQDGQIRASSQSYLLFVLLEDDRDNHLDTFHALRGLSVRSKLQLLHYCR